MEKKYQIFVSSTYTDLIEERQKVIDSILSMYQFPVGMEMFSAADEDQWSIIKRTINSSDFYVLILAKRYGCVIESGEDAGISYTEKEFRYAESQKIPVLTFIKNDNAITADKVDENPENLQKLEALKKKILSKREVEWFSNADELASKVSISLYKAFTRRERPGWVRGDSIDIEKSLNEMVALNKRIRELEKENEELKASQVKRAPHLNVRLQLIGSVTDDDFKKSDSDDDSAQDEKPTDLSTSISITRTDVQEEGYLKEAEKITIDDVPYEVRDKVTQEDLDEYYSKFPDQAIIDKYDEEMRFYNEIRRNGKKLNFIIDNDGTQKATDINVKISFPQEFFLIEREKIRGFKQPEKPKLPENPVDKALREHYQAGIGAAERQLSQLERLYGSTLATPVFPYSNVDITRLTPITSSVRWDFEIEGQDVKIWSRDLLHTDSDVSDELLIVPMQKGTFKVQVRAMCEEYIEPQVSELEIVVN